jgi:transcriptional regulator with XRE-family HTH domain
VLTVVSTRVCKCKQMGNTGDMARIGELGGFIREQRDQAQMSLRQLAQAAGVSNPYLSQVERGLRNPSAEILGRIAQGLRISAETLYVQAGILDDRAGDATVTTAIAADASLTERQRATLLQIYAAFQSENAARAGTDSTGTTPPENTTTSEDQNNEH